MSLVSSNIFSVSLVTLTKALLCLNRFIVPISCVICNDIMAYMFGFFFGRTPLIKVGCLTVHSLENPQHKHHMFTNHSHMFLVNCHTMVKDYSHLHFWLTHWRINLVSTPWLCPLQLSPKKTWEGFIGGFFATIVFGILVRQDLNVMPI